MAKRAIVEWKVNNAEAGKWGFFSGSLQKFHWLRVMFIISSRWSTKKTQLLSTEHVCTKGSYLFASRSKPKTELTLGESLAKGRTEHWPRSSGTLELKSHGEEAEHLFVQVMKTKLGADYPDTLNSMKNLTLPGDVTILRSGCEAINLLQKYCLAKQKQILGLKHFKADFRQLNSLGEMGNGRLK